jgi:hypothetical protein
MIFYVAIQYTMTDPISPHVTDLLKKATGISSKEAWKSIFLIVSKSEHDNENRQKAFLTAKGGSVFAFRDALEHDWRERGVTAGLVGFTTAYSSRDAKGDAMELFKEYKKLGGKHADELLKNAIGCTKSKAQCEKLMAIIDKVCKDKDSFALYIQAQWQMLVNPGGYIHDTMKAWKKVGVEKPSPLAIATIFDAALNQGAEGEHGACKQLLKIGIEGDENEALRRFNLWRRTIAGKRNYASCEHNGKSRADMFEILRKEKAFTLEGKDAERAIQNAIRWEMK